MFKKAVLILALLTLLLAQSENSDKKRTSPKVGGAQAIELDIIEDSMEKEIRTEVLKKSKEIYQETPDSANDPLVRVVSMTKQVVSGLVYVIVWETSSGKLVEIKVYIKPWVHKTKQERFPTIDNQVTVRN